MSAQLLPGELASYKNAPQHQVSGPLGTRGDACGVAASAGDGAGLGLPGAPAATRYTAATRSCPPEARCMSYGAQARQVMGPGRCERKEVCALMTPSASPSGDQTLTTC